MRPPAPPTSIYTLPLHDALPIFSARRSGPDPHADPATAGHPARRASMTPPTWEQARARWAEVNTYWLSTVRPDGRPHAVPLLGRSEEHTSELQSRENLVCRLLLE